MTDLRKIQITATLTYDAAVMHGDDPESKLWFHKLLWGDNLQLGDFGDLGDMIGEIKISEIREIE